MTTASMTVETITPERAAQILQHNDKNRPLNRQHVQELAQAMRRGEWRLNYEPVKIGASGRLLDGQHRLHAVIKTGASVEMAVVTGVDDAVFDTIDTGKRRGAWDVLAIDGEHQTAALAAGLRLLLIHESGRMNMTLHFSNAEIRDALARHPGIRASLPRISGLRQILNPGHIVFLGYRFEQRHPDLARNFFDRLDDGAGMARGHPILMLRDRLTLDRASKARLPGIEVLALCIKAWNAYVRGQPVKVLRWSSGGNEPFPEIR